MAGKAHTQSTATEPPYHFHLTIISGGFTSGFGDDRLSSYLTRTAELRGYWSTASCAVNGQLQIVFRNGANARILMRDTVLEFAGVGLVVMEDANIVMGISEEIGVGPEEYRAHGFWKTFMTQSAVKDKMRMFAKSCREIAGKKLCIVDMSVLENEKEVCSVHDVVTLKSRRTDTRADTGTERWEQDFGRALRQLPMSVAKEYGLLPEQRPFRVRMMQPDEEREGYEKTREILGLVQHVTSKSIETEGGIRDDKEAQHSEQKNDVDKV